MGEVLLYAYLSPSQSTIRFPSTFMFIIYHKPEVSSLTSTTMDSSEIDLEAYVSTINPYATPIERRHRDSRREKKGEPKPVYLDFCQRLGRIGLEDLFYIDEKTNERTVNLATLQRMNLYALQMELVDEVAEVDNNYEVLPGQMARIKGFMADYAQAIRDWELIVKNSSMKRDPFILRSNEALHLRLMNEAGLLEPSASLLKRCYDFSSPQLPFESRGMINRRSKLKAFWARFYMAMFGGLALIGPMILMVLKQSLITALVTVSVSVFLFGFILAAFFPDLGPETVLGSVAGYAAVLVVFVGTSNTSGPQGVVSG